MNDIKKSQMNKPQFNKQLDNVKELIKKVDKHITKPEPKPEPKPELKQFDPNDLKKGLKKRTSF